MAKSLPYFSIMDSTLERALRSVRDASPGAKAVVDYERYVLMTGSTDQQTITLRVANADGGLLQTIESTGKTDLVVSADFELAFLIADMDFVKYMSGVITFSPSKRVSAVTVSADGIDKHLRHNVDVVDDFPGDVSTRLSLQFSFTVDIFDRRLRLAMVSAGGSPGSKSNALHFGVVDGEVIMASVDPYRGMSLMAITPEDLEITGTELRYTINGKSARALIRALIGFKGRLEVHGEHNGGQVGFVFGGTTIMGRLFPPPFFESKIAQQVQVETQATVNRETFLNALGLINSSAGKGNERARVTFNENGSLVVEAAGHTSAVVARMAGMCTGPLPMTLIIESSQVASVVDDLKGDLVQLGVAGARGWFYIGSPIEPQYIHYAVPINKEMPIPTISDDNEQIAA